MNLLPSFSFIVRSLVSMRGLIVIVFVTVSDVLGFTIEMLYVPGIQSMASFATPFVLVLTFLVFPFHLNVMRVFLSSFPFFL